MPEMEALKRPEKPANRKGNKNLNLIQIIVTTGSAMREITSFAWKPA